MQLQRHYKIISFDKAKFLFDESDFVYHTAHSLIRIAVDTTKLEEKSDAAKFCR
jgi:hypothetical protein